MWKSMWQRGAAAAVLAFVLVACGGDDATDVAVADDADFGQQATSTTANAADSSDGEHTEESEEHTDESEDHADEHEDHDEEDGSSRGLGAHEHGVAELSVAWSEGEVVVDLISPTHNIFGFEHEPSTDEESALVADRTEALSEPDVIVFNGEAGCKLADEVATTLEFEGSHAELTASWLFSCNHPDHIRQMDVAALFAEFPNLEDIDAQWASPSGQSAAELSPTAAVLGLE